MEGKHSIGPFSPCAISFNDNAIARNFYPEKFFAFFEAFQRFDANLRKFAYDHLLLEPRSACSQAYHSDFSLTEPINFYTTDHFHSF